MGKVKPEPALDLRTEHFQHAAGAGAEIEERTKRPIAERRADGGFDLFIGNVKLADTIPLPGMLAEIGLRGGGMRLAYFGEALSIAREHGIGWIKTADQVARERKPAAKLPETEKRPRPLTESLH
jgi:hypothetical protein